MSYKLNATSTTSPHTFSGTLFSLSGIADTATAATHYFVETATDGYIRPKTLANVKTELVTTAAVNTAATAGLYDTGYQRIYKPGGGYSVGNAASVTGAIQIVVPVTANNRMIRFTVKIFEYATGESFEVNAGGYWYTGTDATAGTWANNPFAYIVGDPSVDRDFTVRMGRRTADNYGVIYIGELASTWQYPQVYVTDVQQGHTTPVVDYTTNWSISFQSTAFENVTATITSNQVGRVAATAAVDTNTTQIATTAYVVGQGYAKLASPTLTGTPAAPTAAQGTNTTQLATTAFVRANAVPLAAAATAGFFDNTTTVPNTTTRLNYGGYFYPTYINLSGSSDTATAATHYFVETGSDGYVRPKTLANVRKEIEDPTADYCVLSCSSQAIDASTQEFFIFDTEGYDANGWHAASSDSIYVPSAGIYMVSGQVNFAVNSVGDTRQMKLERFSSGAVSMDNILLQIAPRGAGATVLSTSGIFVCSAGDYIKMSCYQNGTTAPTTMTCSAAIKVYRMAEQ